MNDQTKHPIIAFLLSVFPGGGQFYYKNIFRGMFYFIATFFPILGAVFLTIVSNSDIFMLIALIGVFFFAVSFIDTIIVGIKRNRVYSTQQEVANQTNGTYPIEKSDDSERFFTIVLSFIPGVGHFQLGLMQRGLTFLTAFLGAGIMIFFIAIFIRQDVFLVFMAFLPIVWVYSFFDAIQLLNKKQRGEVLEDRSILEDLEKNRQSGRKSKTIATLLSVFPGVGHLYLGYQQRGIQLMAGFLISLYIIDTLRLGIFLFLIPLIWFYSFFDGLQKASQHGESPVDDKPLIPYLMKYKRWIGIGLVLLGAFFILDRVFIPSIAPMLTNILHVDISRWYYEYFQIVVISILLIGGGLKLITSSKKKQSEPGELGEPS